MNGRNLLFSSVLAILLMMATIPTQAQDLIINGNFEQTSGFDYSVISDYARIWSGGVGAGEFIHDATSTGHGIGNLGWPDNLTGHGGSGYYLLFNGYGGSQNSSKAAFRQQVNVVSHSGYTFKCYVRNLSQYHWLYGGNAATIQLRINGVAVDENVPLDINSYDWVEVTRTWYSGNVSGPVNVEIVDVYNGSPDNGDDFGLDDVSFTLDYTIVVEANNDPVITCFETPVDINPMTNDVVSPSWIVPNVTFTLLGQPEHGNLQLLSGTTYRYTPNTGYAGNDVFSYRLRYGTGNDAISSYGYVDITVNARPQRTINMDACENYTWSYTGQTYTQSGQYTYIKSSPNACDSLLILNLTIHHGDEVNLPAVETCDEYTWHGTTYTSSGTYDYQTTTEWGCVRIEHLPLTIHYSDTLEIPVSACEQYTWHGQTYTNSGTYTHWTTNSFNCDRLERLILTISDRFHHIDNVTECDSYYWPRTHQWYYQSTLDSVSVDGPPGGCDSTFVLNLTLHFADTLDVEPVEACDSYVWHGITYTTSGIKTYMTTNEYGCDRLERLNLTIHNSESIELDALTECDSYTWHGQTYTQSGVAVFDTVNQYGCSLQYLLPLTINHSDTLDWDPVTECDSYLWYGQTITESGSYSHNSTNPEGCDRLERIYVTINYSAIDTLTPMTACDSYDWHGETYTQSGTYTYEGEGPTGCPYTEVLQLTVNSSSVYEFNTTSCEPYEWYGEVYDQPGIYYHELTNSQGCDSLLIMHLEIGDIYMMEENVVGCNSYEWYGTVYTQDGDYQHEIENPNGCDSLFIIHLTISPTYIEEFDAESCYAYTWIDETYQQSGDYERHFNSVMGCDSLVTMHLTILEDVHYEFEQQTCGEFTWNDITYYNEGYYEQTFTGSNGCDSIVTMHLVFREALTSDFDRQSCNTIQWYENICDHNGDYQHTFQSVQGCDSIVTMHFSLTDAIVHEYDTLACHSFNWYSQSCDEDGEYSHTFQTPQGCDSTVIMHLQLNVTQIHTQSQSACDSTYINGVLYDQPGTYNIYVDTLFNQSGCDSIIHCVNLTVRNSEQMAQIEGSHEVYVASNIVTGIYRYSIDTAGIVSSITWSLTNPDWRVLDHDSVSCRILVTTPGSGILKANFRVADCGEMERQFPINAGFFGVDNHESVEAHIYPNPTKGTVTIEAEGIESVRLINMMGQTLDWVEADRADHVTLNLNNLSPSIYLLEIDTVNGMVKRRVVVCR